MPRSRQPLPRRTQFFSSTLLLLMERNEINQVELGAATGIAVSRINNYLRGKYRTIRPDHLGLIAKAVGRTPAECGEVARAYILDVLPEALYPIVRVEVAGARQVAGRPDGFEKCGLPATAAAALAQLQAMSLRDAKARARLLWFAGILREAHGA
jgi:transcriptional regulator with XRE-family HTH domain